MLFERSSFDAFSGLFGEPVVFQIQWQPVGRARGFDKAWPPLENAGKPSERVRREGELP